MFNLDSDTFHHYDPVFRTFTGRVLRRGRGNMLERLCLKLLNISRLPAVVALVPRTTPPFQLGQDLVGDLIRGSEVGLISTNITHADLRFSLKGSVGCCDI